MYTAMEYRITPGENSGIRKQYDIASGVGVGNVQTL